MILCPTLFLLASCKEEPILPDKGNCDCVFVQNDEDRDGLIDDTERALLTECSENLLTSKTDIEKNLLGEWELIGHGEGWFPTPSQPCGHLTISPDQLIWKWQTIDLDTVATFSWEIEEFTQGSTKHFRLMTTPSQGEGLFMSQFCQNYMYDDATPVDGNMYLYEKVE